MDDGNPDMQNGMINFKKREMIFGAIRELLQPQMTPYPFPVVEPAFTFLRELPYNPSDEDLYDLSNYIEPKTDKKKK